MSDRALRYRSNSPECRPPDPRICHFCGSSRNVEVHHVDGREENTVPRNLSWACRSCNVRIGLQLSRSGLGRPTRQFNPSGAQSLGQWMAAVLSVKGQSDQMNVSDAVAMIHATPPEDRSAFARQIWNIRRQRGTDVRPTPPF